MKLKGFLGPTYQGRSPALDPSRAINFFCELNPDPDGKDVLSLVGTPGLKRYADLKYGPVRGLHAFNERLYAVASSRLIEIRGKGDTRVVGRLNTKAGRVSMQDNGVESNGAGGNQLFIVDGVDGYIFDAKSREFSAIPRALSGPIKSVDVTDGGAGFKSTPTVSADGPTGMGAKLKATLTLYDAEVSDPGKEYWLKDKIAIDSQTTLTVKAVCAVSLAIDTAGTGYVAGDTLTPAKGKFTADLVATVDEIDGGGGITKASITTGGSCTEMPPLPIEWDASGAGTGAALTVVWGVSDVSVKHQVTKDENISASSVSGDTKPVKAQSGNGSSSMTTINIGGIIVPLAPSGDHLTDGTVFEVASDNDGKTDTTDSGTPARSPSGAIFKLLWSIYSIDVVEMGKGYDYNSTAISITGGNPTTPARATANIGITNGGFPKNPSTTEYLDGYFLVTSGTQQFWSSNLYDGMNWHPMAVAVASATNDPVSALVNLSQQLFLVKSGSTEVWYDAATPTSVGSPFARMDGLSAQYGTLAPYSVALGDNSFFMLGSQMTSGGPSFAGVIEFAGSSPAIVSTPAIAYTISQFERMDDAFGYCYAEDGHTFYVLTFPTANRTLVYDSTVKMWHERSSYKESSAPYPVRHRGNCYARFNGKNMVGDCTYGYLFEMGSKFVDEDGDPIVSTRVSVGLFDSKDFENVFISRLFIDMETGLSDPANILTPRAMLSWSNDGGFTWSNEYEAQIGRIGAHRYRLIWRRLGYARDRVFKLTISEPMRKVLVSAYAEGSN